MLKDCSTALFRFSQGRAGSAAGVPVPARGGRPGHQAAHRAGPRRANGCLVLQGNILA